MKYSLQSTLTLEDQLTSTIDVAEGGITRFARTTRREMSSLVGPIQRVSRALNRGLLIAVTAVLAAFTAGMAHATREYIEFDQAITQATARFGDVDVAAGNFRDRVDEIGEAAREVASVTEFTATEVAGALEKMAMAGMESELALALLPQTVDLATSAGIDLVTATDIVTDSMAAFNLMSDDPVEAANNLARMSDVLAKGANKANMDITIFFESVKNGASVFTMTGQSIETYTSLLGILANNSVKGARAGTMLRNMQIRLASPTAAAQQALDDLGVTIADEHGNMRDIIDIIADLEHGLAGLGNVEQSAILDTIFGDRTTEAIAIFLKDGSDALREFREELIESEGYTEDLAKAARSSIENMIKVIESGLLDIGFEIIEAFRGQGVGILEQFTQFVQDFDPQPVIDFLLIVVDVGSKAFGILKIIWPVLLGLAVAIKVVAFATGVLNIALGTSPIIWILLGVTALVAGLVLLIRHFDQVKAWGTALGEFFTQLAQTINDFGLAAMQAVADFVMWLVDIAAPYVIAYGQTLMTFMLSPINLIISAVAGLLDLLGLLPGRLGKPFRDASDAVKGFQDDMNQLLTGSEEAFDLGGIWDQAINANRRGPDTYATPGTAAAESRQYRETVNRQEVYVRPDHGAVVSREPGGIPELALSLGLQ